jgi:hypothetical protein
MWQFAGGKARRIAWLILPLLCLRIVLQSSTIGRMLRPGGWEHDATSQRKRAE